MAKRRLFIAAVITLTIVLSLALAACGPSSYAAMSSVQQKYYDKTGEYYTALGAGGLVRYTDRDTGLYGYVDASSGEVLIEARFSSATKFAQGIAVVNTGAPGTSSRSIIDESGAVLVNGLEDYEFYPGAVIAKKDGKWGVWNNKGKAVIPAEYDGIDMAYGSYIVHRGGKYGLADSKGKIVIPLEYAIMINDYDEDINAGDIILALADDGRIDYLDFKGNLIKSGYESSDLIYLGFGRYVEATGSGSKLQFWFTDNKVEKISRLPDGFELVNTVMTDEDNVLVTTDSSSYYLFNIETEDLTPVKVALVGEVRDEDDKIIVPGVMACGDGDSYTVYGSEGAVFTVPAEQVPLCKMIEGTFRNYMFNTATNTLTDLINGESVKLGNEVVAVTDAEEGMFVVQNKDGEYAACAKNGTLLTEFCFDRMTAYSDGFVGYRGNVCEWYGTEGNLILRSDKMNIW